MCKEVNFKLIHESGKEQIMNFQAKLIQMKELPEIGKSSVYIKLK